MWQAKGRRFTFLHLVKEVALVPSAVLHLQTLFPVGLLNTKRLIIFSEEADEQLELLLASLGHLDAVYQRDEFLN